MISAARLRKTLAVPKLRARSVLLDASWHLPNAGRDAHQEFLEERIPGARFFDIDKICDRSSPLPHMLPTAQEFERAMDALGIANDSSVYVYTKTGAFSGPRCWWHFRYMGHKDVHLLNGGLSAWMAEGGEVEGGRDFEQSSPHVSVSAQGDDAPRRYRATPNPDMVVSLQQVLDNTRGGAMAMVDARPAGRFHGSVPEPRPGLASGHIPGSVSVPFSELVSDDSSSFKLWPQLMDVFTKAGLHGVLDPQQRTRVMTTCGSGVSAAVVTMAMHLTTGKPLEELPVYDGSWSEYGANPDHPVSRSGESSPPSVE